MGLALLLLFACQRGALVESVAPADIPAGDRIEVFGQHFRPEASWSIVDGDVHFPLEQVVIDAGIRVSALVPVFVQPGTYDVLVSEGDAVQGLVDVLTVRPPRAEVPCTGEYTTNTQLSLLKKLVIIDRFHRTGERETLKIGSDEITAVEYERRPTDAGYCSAIFVRRADGSRVLFDDDLKVELKSRAQKMAQDLQKPIELLADADLPPVAPPR
jgi:hypothetical protein